MSLTEEIMATETQIKRVADLKYDNAYYRTTEPLISDADYDALRKEYSDGIPTTHTLMMLAPQLSTEKKYTHTKPMLSTSKNLER